MEKKEQLYEGKAKKVYATEDPNLVICLLYTSDAALSLDGRGADVRRAGDHRVGVERNVGRGLVGIDAVSYTHLLPALSASTAENRPANSAKQTSKTKYAAARISGARKSFKSSCVSPPENRRIEGELNYKDSDLPETTKSGKEHGIGLQ